MNFFQTVISETVRRRPANGLVLVVADIFAQPSLILQEGGGLKVRNVAFDALWFRNGAAYRISEIKLGSACDGPVTFPNLPCYVFSILSNNSSSGSIALHIVYKHLYSQKKGSYKLLNIDCIFGPPCILAQPAELKMRHLHFTEFSFCLLIYYNAK